MTHLRAIGRLLALAALTARHALVLVVRLARAGRGRQARLDARIDQFQRWCRGIARWSGMRIDWHGAPPSPPFLLVANHLSYMDVIALGAVAPAIFVAKAPIARWPLLGPITRLAGTIFIDRTRPSDLKRALAEIGAVLDAGHGVVLFPEGTSTAGDRVLPFRSPLLAAALERGLPVHAVALSYRTGPGLPPARDAVCWWGDATLAPHLYRLLRMRGFTADVSFAPVPRSDGDRKRLAERLRRDVAAMLGLEPAVEDPCLPGKR